MADTFRPTRVVISSPESYEASAMLNANGFVRLKGVATACATRLGLMWVNANHLLAAERDDVERFSAELEKVEAREPGVWGAMPPEHQTVIEYDTLHVTNALLALLTSLKSLLDNYGLLAAGLIAEDKTNMSFTRQRVGTVSPDSISGGELINWLRGRRCVGFTRREELATALETHSRSWISKAVDYRDDLVHRSRIKGMQLLQVPASMCSTSIDPQTFELPKMPDGQTIAAYADRLCSSTRSLLWDTLWLLPNVDPRALSIYDQSRPFPP